MPIQTFPRPTPPLLEALVDQLQAVMPSTDWFIVGYNAATEELAINYNGNWSAPATLVDTVQFLVDQAVEDTPAGRVIREQRQNLLPRALVVWIGSLHGMTEPQARASFEAALNSVSGGGS